MREARTLERTDLNDQVYASLKQQLATRKLAPGERLSLQDLAERFGVSRSPVQNALTRLVAEGLVSVKPRSGHYVRPLTATVVVEAYDVREALELHAAERTVGRLGRRELRELRRLMEATLRTIDGRRFVDRAGYLATNAALHERQIALVGNALLLETYRSLCINVLMGRLLAGQGDDCAGVAAEHVELVEAFEAGSLDRARAVIRTHMETGKRLALEAIERSGGVL